MITIWIDLEISLSCGPSILGPREHSLLPLTAGTHVSGRVEKRRLDTPTIENAEWKLLSLQLVLSERCRIVRHRELGECSMKKERVLKRQSIQRQWAWMRGHWVKWLKNPTVWKLCVILGRVIVWVLRLFKTENPWPRHFHFFGFIKERLSNVKRSASAYQSVPWY